MRRLILFRHAKAEPRAAGEDDFDRPLAERGREDAALVGQALARQGFAPDAALISPARRTAETWIYARAAGYVRDWKVDIGIVVDEGQILLELDTPELDAEIAAIAAADPVAKRLLQLRGVGPMTATALVATIGDGAQFCSSRSRKSAGSRHCSY